MRKGNPCSFSPARHSLSLGTAGTKVPGSSEPRRTVDFERHRHRGLEGEALDGLLRVVSTDGLPGYWRWQYQRLAGIPDSEPMLLTEALAGSADVEGSFPWLHAAVAKRGSWLLHLSQSPAFDSLRDGPRFWRSLRRLGLLCDRTPKLNTTETRDTEGSLSSLAERTGQGRSCRWPSPARAGSGLLSK